MRVGAGWEKGGEGHTWGREGDSEPGGARGQGADSWVLGVTAQREMGSFLAGAE